MRKIRIFDTTLRDGEQTPGVNLNLLEKVEIAKQLERLQVDVIEAGFPAASQGDYEAVLEVSREVRGAMVAGLCRAKSADVQRAWEALRYAEQPLIHIFLATSELHMLYKLRMSEQAVLDAAVHAVKTAKTYCQEVEFSAEDASRSNPQFLAKVVQAVIAAGATVVNLPDTVGYITPDEYIALLHNLQQQVPNLDKAIISAHCHNDLGLAVANSLAFVEAGAGQVEVTVNGIGERAGNAALEEVVMALQTRADYFQAETAVESRQLFKTSRLVSKYTGLDISPSKAIIGDNAFRHQSGIHQHGVMAEPSTYEIMTPESIGRNNFDGIVLGKLSGRHAFAEKMQELGYHLSEQELDQTFEKFKLIADRKKEISLKDIDAIIEGRLSKVPVKVELVNYQILSANQLNSTATVVLQVEGEVRQMAAIAGGPVDAAFKAITEILGLPISLESYQIKAVTEGADALGEVTVRVQHGESVYLGKGVSTDIIKSSMLAFINAVNRIYTEIALQQPAEAQPPRQ